MTATPAEYVRIPTRVEAWEVTISDLQSIARWCKGTVRGESIRFAKPRSQRNVLQPDNSHYAVEGDFIVRVKDGFTVIPGKEFKQRYVFARTR